MGEELSDKIKSLSEKDSNLLYEDLYSILNDRLGSLLYGGITSKEYADPPADKIKKIKERLYLEMFNEQ
jgi:hypothetical protein